MDLTNCPKLVVGDVKKIRTLVANLTANAGMCCVISGRLKLSYESSVKYTESGKVTVECHAFDEPAGLRDSGGVAVEIVVADTGCGIANDKLESIFREFEQVEMDQHAQTQAQDQGLGMFPHTACAPYLLC